MAIPAWLTLSTNSGSGDSIVTITASSYNELTARTASLTVSGSTKSVNIGVLQEGTGVLDVSPSIITFTNTGGVQTVVVTTNVGDWSITDSIPAWLSFSQTTGTIGQTIVTITADTLSTPERRAAPLHFTDGINTIILMITQNGVFSVSPSTFTFPASGGVTSFTVNAYTSWSITNIPAWITMSQVSGMAGTYVVTMTADTNSTYTARSDTFVVTCNTNTKNCSVSQAANELNVSPTAFTFVWSGQTKTFTVQTYGNDWYISSYPEWLSFSTYTGSSGTTTVTVSADTNTMDTGRTGTFEISDGERTVTCSVDQNFKTPYLTFEVISDGNIKWMRGRDVQSTTIQYRKNDGNWTSITSASANPTTISVVAGDIVEFKGTNYSYGTSAETRGSFSGSTATFNVSGNLMTMIAGDNYSAETTVLDYAFRELFRNTKVVSAASLKLPATSLGQYCYAMMFSACKSLITPPAILPATACSVGCYDYMFNACSGLTSAPQLPATELAGLCYECMFRGCSSLTTAPALPATTLANRCYAAMFQECTSLTTAPVISATTLAEYCCGIMFYGCTSLTTVQSVLPATTLANTCYNGMFSNCTSLTTAPELPATSLTTGCYHYMFDGCSNLNYIKCLAMDISATDCTVDWVDGVAANGTFVKNQSMTSWTTGVDGIPSGWTVVDAT